MAEIIQPIGVEKAELSYIVGRAINILAPYFLPQSEYRGILSRANFPDLKIRGSGGYMGDSLFVPWHLLERGDVRGDLQVGHEIGHFGHNIVNPYLFTPEMRKNFVRSHLVEAVAEYASIIYMNGKNPFENPIFALDELSRMKIEEGKKFLKDIFYLRRLLENEEFNILRRKN